MRIWEKSHHSIFTFKTSNPRVSRVHSKNVQKDKQTSRLCSAFNENKIKRKCLFKKKIFFVFRSLARQLQEMKTENIFFLLAVRAHFLAIGPCQWVLAFLASFSRTFSFEDPNERIEDPDISLNVFVFYHHKIQSL